MKITGKALGLALILLSGTVAAESYYKWDDDKGITHFTKAPPRDRPSEQINTYAGSSTKYDPSEAIAATTEAKNEKTQLENTKEQEAKAAALTEEKCKVVSEQLKTMNERGRIRMKNKDGTERVMTPEEQKQKIDDYNKFISENCSGKKPTKEAETKPEIKPEDQQATKQEIKPEEKK